MKVTVNNLPKSRVELTVELTGEELSAHLGRAVEKISKEIKIDGFRPGKATYEALKTKVGEISIWEEAARLAIAKTADEAIRENASDRAVGQPEINITKLAPNNPFEYKIIISILPEVMLGAYKELKVKMDKIEVGDKEVDKMIKDLREMRVKEVVSDEPIKDSDKTIVDINIFLDQVPIEGGQGKDTAVIIGKGYVVPGFDKHLIGAKKDEEREFDLPYPADHYQKNLAGKIVQFKVKVKEVYKRELPALDDNFCTGFGMKNLDELRARIKESLTSEKAEKARQKAEIIVLDKIIDKTKFGELPDNLIMNEGETMLSELAHNLEHQGANFDDYLKSLNKTREQLKLDLLPDAVKRVKSALIIRQIAEIEKIEALEAEVEKEVAHILEHYKGDKKVEERVKSHEYHHYLHNALTNKKTMEKLAEWNVEK
jgi:trigger factor